MGNQIYISQLSKSLILHRLFFEVKKVDVRLNEILILKFISFFFDSVYQTRPYDTITQQWKYDYVNGLGSFFATSYYTLYQQKPGSKIPCILLLGQNIRSSLFLQILFFIPSFQHQDSNSYYLVVATAKIRKN